MLDVSHTSGSEAVAALVVFQDGIKFSNDYAAMYEVLTRRYKKAKEDNELPDLILVDGGKGQLAVAIQVLSELNITGVDLIGVAKEEGRYDKGMSAEQVFLQDEIFPLILHPHSPALFLLQNIRDEAHRFVLNFHTKRRSKKVFDSQLDHLAGIGPKKKKKLLMHFGSLKKIKEASLEELLAVKGISKKDAQTLLLEFGRGAGYDPIYSP